jgi:hypothetical protein
MSIIKNFNDFLNESWHPYDAYETGESNCCGAPIMQGGICSDCKEHCEAEEEDFKPGNDLPNVEGF